MQHLPRRWKPSHAANTLELQPLTTEERSQDHEELSPPPVPEELQLHRLTNLGVPACYLVVGTCQGLFRPLLNVYPLALGATEAQQTTLATIATVPAALKLLYGFGSDAMPIYGYRRKPYLFLGWLLSTCSMFQLAYTTQLVKEPNDETPTMPHLTISFFLFGLGLWIADVMADSIVAQKARLEDDRIRGQLQSTCYACRFFGLMVAAPLTTWVYDDFGPFWIVTALGTLPILLWPLIFTLAEDRTAWVPLEQQLSEIWNLVCRQSVWQPMAFVYLFNLLQVTNAAWRQFLHTVYGFGPGELNSLLVASYVLLYVGTMVYKYCFLHASWRLVYQVCLFLNAIVSSLQLLLIRGISFSPFWFALGDDAMAEFLTGLQFLPVSLLMVSLCPPGSEGASYAMLTTVWNSAMMLAPAWSSLLLGIWDTSEAAMERGDLDGLFNLSILTTLIQLSPVLILRWLPHGREDLLELSNKPGSPVGGAIFLCVLFGSMFWTLLVALLNIVKPGWAGGS